MKVLGSSTLHAGISKESRKVKRAGNLRIEFRLQRFDHLLPILMGC
jgi:hypothetical protein